MSSLRLLLFLGLSCTHISLIKAASSEPGQAGCRPGEVAFRHRGDLLCHSLTPPLPFAAALRSCRAAGGHLATIYSQRHNDLLYGMLHEAAYIGAVARQLVERHPRGLGPGLVWAWLSGEPRGFVNLLVNETRAFHSQPSGGGFEGCMELMKHPMVDDDAGNGYWGDIDCRTKLPAVCTRTVRAARPPPAVARRRFRLAPATSRWDACAAGFHRAGVTRQGEPISRSACLSALQTSRSFSAALSGCQTLSPAATLWRPGRRADPRRWRRLAELGAAERVWAGASRRNARLQWRWQEDGSAVARAAWAAGEPRDEPRRDCAAYDAGRRGLVAADCDAPLPGLCETPPRVCPLDRVLDARGAACVRRRRSDCGPGVDRFEQARRVGAPCQVSPCPAVCPNGTVQLGSSCWEVTRAEMTFLEASRFCRARGMRVARVTSDSENAFVQRQVTRLGRPVWLWVRVPQFTRFHRYTAYGLPDEPNEAPGTCPIVWFDGEWMDVDCDSAFPVVCKRLVSRAECAEAQAALKASR